MSLSFKPSNKQVLKILSNYFLAQKQAEYDRVEAKLKENQQKRNELHGKIKAIKLAAAKKPIKKRIDAIVAAIGPGAEVEECFTAEDNYQCSASITLSCPRTKLPSARENKTIAAIQKQIEVLGNEGSAIERSKYKISDAMRHVRHDPDQILEMLFLNLPPESAPLLAELTRMMEAAAATFPGAK